ncbi:MAG TPA: PDZ domain-containing protein, partial [Dehalococcoidia bacterium]|nr:PDZ domain-containing protein [Dehalococcoidia bacterium]
QCPACALGLCLRSSHGASTVRQAWRDTETPAPDGGLRIREPRSGSEAQRVGLRADDQVVAIDATAIATDLETSDVQRSIRAHDSGDIIVLTVRRGQEEQFEAVVRRP